MYILYIYFVKIKWNIIKVIKYMMRLYFNFMYMMVSKEIIESYFAIT